MPLDGGTADDTEAIRCTHARGRLVCVCGLTASGKRPTVGPTYGFDKPEFEARGVTKSKLTPAFYSKKTQKTEKKGKSEEKTPHALS
jgi:hypothetical protein